MRPPPKKDVRHVPAQWQQANIACPTKPRQTAKAGEDDRSIHQKTSGYLPQLCQNWRSQNLAEGIRLHWQSVPPQLKELGLLTSTSVGSRMNHNVPGRRRFRTTLIRLANMYMKLDPASLRMSRMSITSNVCWIEYCLPEQKDRGQRMLDTICQS